MDLYHERLQRFDKPARPVGVHSPGHIAATDEQAKEELFPHHLAMMNRIGAERGWPPSGRREFEHAAGPDGALYVADEVFFTGTAAELTPIRELDDRVIGSGEPGPMTKKIQETYFAAARGARAG